MENYTDWGWTAKNTQEIVSNHLFPQSTTNANVQRPNTHRTDSKRTSQTSADHAYEQQRQLTTNQPKSQDESTKSSKLANMIAFSD
jgi:hypothetical protein